MSHRESALMPWIASYTDSFSAAGASTLTLTGFGLGLSTDVDLGTLGTETGRTYTATDGDGNGNLVISLNVATLPESPATVQVAVSNGGVPAQQSPLSVIHGWNPTEISSLVAWFDAADASTITKDSSDLVGQWDDKSGNGHHAVQSTTNRKPKYLASGGSIGGAHVSFGHDSLYNTLVTNDANFAAVSPGGKTNSSVFVVFHAPGGGGDDASGIFATNSQGSPWITMAIGTAGSKASRGTHIWKGSVKCGSGTPFSSLPTKILGGFILSDTGMITRVNGSEDDTHGTFYTGQSFTQPLMIGHGWNDTQWPDLEIAELLVFNLALAGDDLSDVESYLNTKWSIWT